MKNTQTDLLTLQEVADYLRISMVSCHGWVKDGKLPAIRVGREWRVRQSDLDSWMDSNRNTEGVA